MFTVLTFLKKKKPKHSNNFWYSCQKKKKANRFQLVYAYICIENMN